METPVSLLERLRQPDNSQVSARFLDLYTPLLYRWARGTGLQEADAADLVQEVLVVLYRKLPEFTYDRRGSFRAWLRTVTLNKWREGLRHRAPVAFVTDEALTEVPGVDESAAFEEAAYRRQMVQQTLHTLRSEFPVLSWKAFEEYVLAGRKAEEVAAELRVQVTTIYAAKSRILSRLRQELDGLLD